MFSKTKRQKIRKSVIFISFILFPITIYYLSPYLIIEGIAEGIITGSFIMFSGMLIGSIFFGRLFCGWVCPAAGLQEMTFLVNNKRNKGKWRKWIKYIIWVPWIGIIIALGLNAGGISKIDFLYQTEKGVSISNISGYVIYYAVVFLVFVLSVFGGKRSFCHSICWMAPFMQIGIAIRKILKISGLHLKTNPKECIECGNCTKICTMSLNVLNLVKNKKIESFDCSLCGECVDVCPKNVINYSFKK